MTHWLRSIIVAGSVLVAALASASDLWSQEEVAEPLAPTLPAISFDPTQTYEVFFRLHPNELDRLSNVRVLGMDQLGKRMYLKFQTILNNDRQEGWIELETVSAILPSPRRLVATPELLIDRQVVCDQENVREIRTETVREIIREAPPSIHH
jgi:hypothetical protein